VEKRVSEQIGDMQRIYCMRGPLADGGPGEPIIEDALTIKYPILLTLVFWPDTDAITATEFDSCETMQVYFGLKSNYKNHILGKGSFINRYTFERTADIWERAEAIT
jgi:hypothetical protein